MKRSMLGLFGFVVVVLSGCQLEMVEDDSTTDWVVGDTAGDPDSAEVDVTTDCGQFFNYWQCFCQSGLCSGQLWKTVVPCAQGSCAMVTDVTEVDGKTYQADCSDIGKIQDGVLIVSAGAGLEETIYICIPAPPP